MGFYRQSLTKQLFAFFVAAAGFMWLNQAICQTEPLKICISKSSQNYVNWIKRADPLVQTVDLYAMPIPEAVQQLGQCSGLLLTGGEDVWPGRYGKAFDTVRCTEMNPHRDSLELALIEKALAMKMPVMGVCRGNQILNVYLGGTLIVDIPTDIGVRIRHQCDDYLKCFHTVNVISSSMLSTICMASAAEVTTNHHQAVDRLSPLLISNVVSDDNLIEGVEWKNPEGKAFLLGVQWHPERMDVSNPLSGPIAATFILKSAAYSANRK